MGCYRKEILKTFTGVLMKSTVAVYNSHWSALDAVEVLKNGSYPVDQLSIIGRAKFRDNDMRRKAIKPLKKDGETIGVVLGSSVGVLSKSRILAVPELGFLFGAGAVVEAIADFNMEFKGVKMGTILKTFGIKQDKVEKYRNDLDEGKFLVVAQGEDEDVEKAVNILCSSSRNLEIYSQ